MANPTIKVKRSAVSGKIPTVSQLDLGELAINTFDGKVYTERDRSSVGIGTTVIVINPWTVGTGTNTYDTFFTEGNVGVGSTLPTSKVDVVGDGRFTGVVTATTFLGRVTGEITAQQLNVSGVGTFLSGNLNIRNPANTFGYTIAGGAIVADRTLTLPVVTSNTGIAVTGLNQTFTGTQTFSSTFNHTGGTGTLANNGTAAATANIATGALASGISKTINFGNNGVSGSFTQINVGPTVGVGTVVINSGTNLGIGSATPTSKLTVQGDALVSGLVTATTFYGNIYSTGISTISGFKFPSSDGTAGQFLKTDGFGNLSFATASGGSGVVAGSATSISDDYFTATQGQTVFTSSQNFTGKSVQVFLNGVKLRSTTDFTTTNPSTVTLVSGATVGDRVNIVVSFGNTLEEQTFTATQGQVTFSPSGSFASPSNIKVYVNGIKLRKTIDYGASSSVTLLTAAGVGDEIDLVCDNAEDYFTSIHGQTTFTPTSTDITSSNLQVFLNGVRLENTTDYTIGSPAINLISALNAGDEVDIVITRT